MHFLRSPEGQKPDASEVVLRAPPLRRFLAVLLAVLLPGGAMAPAKGQTFDARSRLVLVPVTVVDAKGGKANPVDGLVSTDFTLLDNGRLQNAVVDSIGTGSAPIALVVAIQTSGLSSAAVAKVRRLGSMFFPLVLGERGSVAVITFDRRVHLVQQWTSDEGQLLNTFRSLRPGNSKGAKLLDAASFAISELNARRSSRRVLLLISESRDRGSESSLNEVVQSAHRSDVIVYAAQYSAFKTGFTRRGIESAGPTPVDQSGRANPEFGTPGGSPPRDLYDPKLPAPSHRVDIAGALEELSRLSKPKAAEVLAEETGGLAPPFVRQKGLENVIEVIGKDLHRQYVLSFKPDKLELGYHRIEVRVARPNVIVRARPGYWFEGSARSTSPEPPADTGERARNGGVDRNPVSIFSNRVHPHFWCSWREGRHGKYASPQ